MRYIDDPVLMRRDLDGSDGNGDYESTFYHITDAMFSTVALMSGGSVIERVTYDPYGRPRNHRGADLNGDGAVDGADLGILLSHYNAEMGDTDPPDPADYSSLADLNRDGIVDGADMGALLGSWGNALPTGVLSLVDNSIGFDGYVHDAVVASNDPSPSANFTLRESCMVRNRTYEPTLGRWVQRDPIGYPDGPNLYEYVGGNTVLLQDPSGLMCTMGCGPIALGDAPPPSFVPTPSNWKSPNSAPVYSDDPEFKRNFKVDPSLEKCCGQLKMNIDKQPNDSWKNYAAYATCCNGKPAVCFFQPAHLNGPKRNTTATTLADAAEEEIGFMRGSLLVDQCMLNHEFMHVGNGNVGDLVCVGKSDGWIEEQDPGFNEERRLNGVRRHCAIYGKQRDCLEYKRRLCEGNGRSATAVAECQRVVDLNLKSVKEYVKNNCKECHDADDEKKRRRK